MAVMHLLLAEGGTPNLWNPTIIGVLAVLSRGRAVLRLDVPAARTNLGARLGFLVAAAVAHRLHGVAHHAVADDVRQRERNSDLDPPHGHSPSWKVVEVVDTSGDSRRSRPCANIATKGRHGDPTADHAGEAAPSTPRSSPAAPVAGQPTPKCSRSRRSGSRRRPTTCRRSRAARRTSTSARPRTSSGTGTEYAAVQFCLARIDEVTVPLGNRRQGHPDVRPAEAHAVRDPRATTSDRSASRWCSTGCSR